jgi:hypothetical protein
MRVALSQAITPTHMARGAAAAALYLLSTRNESPTREALADALRGIWADHADSMADQLIDLTWNAMPQV